MNPGLILAIAVLVAVIWFKQYCLKQANEPKNYQEYLLKLSRITRKHQFEFFTIAAEKDKIPKFLINRDWDTYMKTGKLPIYMISFLDEGKEFIDNTPILI